MKSLKKIIKLKISPNLYQSIGIYNEDYETPIKLQKC